MKEIVKLKFGRHKIIFTYHRENALYTPIVDGKRIPIMIMPEDVREVKKLMKKVTDIDMPSNLLYYVVGGACRVAISGGMA